MMNVRTEDNPCLGQYCPPGYICLENLCCIEKSDSYEVDNELNEWNTTSSFKVTELTTTPILNFSTEKTIIQTTQPVNTEPKNISTTEIYEETLTESYCPIGNSIGECISGECPYNYECIDDMCCKLSENINCKDLLPDCKKHLCQKEEYYDFLTLKCGRTCQRCHQQQFVKAKGKLSSKSNEKALERGKNTSSPKSKKRNLKCRDSRNDCEDWMREGFCYSPIYTLEQKKAICGVSCQLC
uniref:ShKT domain-containing protein n=1 Tax=Parastrongyloides trichosuri TaxID=131310 RepID=A0A0N4ZRE6_PARTI